MNTNKIYFHSSEEMPEVETGLARLVFASPPYTNNPDGKTLKKDSYIEFLERVFRETYRILTPGGVFVTLNTDLKDHSYYNSPGQKYSSHIASFEKNVWLKHAVIEEVGKETGFRLFDYKIWQKRQTTDTFRFPFSHILFFEKPGAKRFSHYKWPCSQHTENFGPGVWYLREGEIRKDSKGYKFPDAIHPEIVRRCVREFTKEGDLVVSPFAGSGTVLSIAHELKRQWIGYEINLKLRKMIKESIYGPRPAIYNK